MDDAIRMIEAADPLRRRVEAITAMIRSWPSWRRQGPAYEAAVRERAELLKAVDRIARPAAAPTSKPPSTRDRRGREAAIQLLAAESAAEQAWDERRSQVESKRGKLEMQRSTP